MSVLSKANEKKGQIMKHNKAIITFILFSLFATTSSVDKYESQFLNYKTMFVNLDRVVFDIIRDECEQQKFNLTVALAFADAESNFNPNAVSSAGARGLFQVMPFWSSEPEKLKDPTYNTRMGLMILHHYFQQANNNLIMAAKYYNAGPNGRVCNANYIAKINYHVFYFEPQTHSQMMSL